jgi:CheY-like chemotaxis protein
MCYLQFPQINTAMPDFSVLRHTLAAPRKEKLSLYEQQVWPCLGFLLYSVPIGSALTPGGNPLVYKKVLILDASEMNRKHLRELFLSGQYETESVADLNGLRKTLDWWQPNLIVVELQLASHACAEIFREVRSNQNRDIAIIVHAAMIESNLARLGEAFGADAVYSTLEGMNNIILRTASVLSSHQPIDASGPE